MNVSQRIKQVVISKNRIRQISKEEVENLETKDSIKQIQIEDLKERWNTCCSAGFGECNKIRRVDRSKMKWNQKVVGNRTGKKYVETQKLCWWLWLFWEKVERRQEKGWRMCWFDCLGRKAKTQILAVRLLQPPAHPEIQLSVQVAFKTSDRTTGSLPKNSVLGIGVALSPSAFV